MTDPATSLLHKILETGALEEKTDAGGRLVLFDTSWIDVTAEEYEVIEAFWRERET